MPEATEMLPAGHRLIELDCVASTNAEAMLLAQAGEVGPLWIRAERQTAGRGRSGRHWVSMTGNLHASLLLTLGDRARTRAPQLSLVAGVAVIDAIRDACGPTAAIPLRIKWPNDILIGRQKAGGILVESSHGPGGLAVVIGIGLNLALHPDETPFPATSLAAYARAPSPRIMLGCLAVRVAGWLERWQEGDGFAWIRTAWLERAGDLGEACSVNLGSTRVEGRFAGLDEDGALLIAEPGGATRRVTFGDFTLSPP